MSDNNNKNNKNNNKNNNHMNDSPIPQSQSPKHEPQQQKEQEQELQEQKPLELQRQQRQQRMQTRMSIIPPHELDDPSDLVVETVTNRRSRSKSRSRRRKRRSFIMGMDKDDENDNNDDLCNNGNEDTEDHVKNNSLNNMNQNNSMNEHDEENDSSTTTATAAAVSASATAVSSSTSSSILTLGSCCYRPVLLLPREMRNLLAGGIAGMTAKSVVAPLDRIKILVQVTPSKTPFQLRTDVLRVASTIVRTEGLLALWKGHTATLLRVFPYAGIQFMVYERVKHRFLQIRQNHHHSSSTPQQSPPHHTPPPFSATGPTIAAATATATATASGLQHRQAQGCSGQGQLTALESLAAGMIAGVVSVTCTYPLDLTRAQLAVLRKHKPSSHAPHAHAHAHSHAPPQTHTTTSTTTTKKFWTVLLDNYRRTHNGGIPGLFRGLSVTLLGILPYSGLAFCFNEQGKRYLLQYHHHNHHHHIHNIHKNNSSRRIKKTEETETLHTSQQPQQSHVHISTVEKLLCGALAGLVAQTVTYPVEVTRRRMQTLGLLDRSDMMLKTMMMNDATLSTSSTSSNGALLTRTPLPPLPSSSSSSPRPPPNVSQTIQTLYAEQGVRGFFKGVSVNWIKGPIGFAISFTVFDCVQRYLDDDENQ